MHGCAARLKSSNSGRLDGAVILWLLRIVKKEGVDDKDCVARMLQHR
jgi:hypothetical protein